MFFFHILLQRDCCRNPDSDGLYFLDFYIVIFEFRCYYEVFFMWWIFWRIYRLEFGLQLVVLVKARRGRRRENYQRDIFRNYYKKIHHTPFYGFMMNEEDEESDSFVLGCI